MDNKFNKTFIYKITAPQTEQIYIGSTTQKINVRFSKHKHDYKRFNAGHYHYVTSFSIVRLEGSKIELIEECNFNTNEEKLQREKYHILQNKNICVNRLMKKEN